jgi:hypothetical protein
MRLTPRLSIPATKSGSATVSITGGACISIAFRFAPREAMRAHGRALLRSLAVAAAVLLVNVSSAESADDANVEEQRTATLNYWESLRKLSLQLTAEMKQLKESSDAKLETEDPVADLTQRAEWLGTMTDRYIKMVAKLPMKGVDDRLLEFEKQDIDLAIRNKHQYGELAVRLQKLAAWKAQSNGLTDPDWMTLLYGFFKVLEGEPSAGLGRALKQSDAADDQGKRLISEYLVALEKMNELLKEADAASVEELSVRAALTKRFGVEFPALDPDD